MLRPLLYSCLLFLVAHEKKAQGLDPLDQAILDRLKTKSAELEIDILGELDKLENYLIANEYLESKESKSYYKVYETLAKEGEFIHYRDYSKKGPLDSLTREEFDNCYTYFRNTKLFDQSKSKYKLLILKFEKKDTNEVSNADNPVRENAKMILEVLEENDFHNPIFKYWALYFLYNTPLDIRFKD